MRDLLELTQLAVHVLALIAAFAAAAFCVVILCCAWESLRDRIDRRRLTRRALDDAARERSLLDQLVPPEQIDRLATDVRTPALTADEMHRLFPDIPREDQ